MTIKELRKEFGRRVKFDRAINGGLEDYLKSEWATLETLYAEGAVNRRTDYISDYMLALAAGYDPQKANDGFTVVRCLDLAYIYATKKHVRNMMMIFLGLEQPEKEESTAPEEQTADNQTTEQAEDTEEQPEEQETAETETAQVAEPENTYEHAVEMASTKPNWFKDVFLPSLLARTEPLNQLWLTQKQTAVCARNMKQSVTRDDYGEHISYHTEWDGRTVEMLYSKKNQCGSIRFSRNAEEQAEADKKAIQEIKSQESERFRNRVKAIQRGNQRAISGTIREFKRLKENLEFMQGDIADGFYDETESCYIQCKQEFDFFSAIIEKTGIQV